MSLRSGSIGFRSAGLRSQAARCSVTLSKEPRRKGGPSPEVGEVGSQGDVELLIVRANGDEPIAPDRDDLARRLRRHRCLMTGGTDAAGTSANPRRPSVPSAGRRQPVQAARAAQASKSASVVD